MIPNHTSREDPKVKCRICEEHLEILAVLFLKIDQQQGRLPWKPTAQKFQAGLDHTAVVGLIKKV
jgi:hypothetical protein